MSEGKFDWVIVLLAGSILAAVAYGGWCDLIDGRLYNPVIEWGTRFAGPTHLVTKRVYAPGEMVFAKVAFQKQRSIPGTIQWSLINSRMFQYPARQGSLPVGIFHGIVRVEAIVPESHEGEHWFCGTITYQINWLSKLTYPVWTDKFEVKR